MIIVKIMGGLGNQLFQYALVEKLKSMGKNVKVDLSYFEDTPVGDTVRDSIYDKLVYKPEVATTDEIENLRTYSFLGRVYTKLTGISKDYFESDSLFKPEILKRKTGYLVGYWQSEKYFQDLRESILEDFDFRRSVEKKINEGQEGQVESVSIHIRGGDYLTKASSTFGGICTKEYYRKAMEYIRKNVEYPKFYIFTNDKKYAEIIMDGIEAEYQYVDWNDESHAYADLLLMSKCKHHILANSSFSWWGEYLSDQTGITIAPSKWTNDSRNKDIYRDNWVEL
ncbi:MAG: alpha-1,2-fucosyltransferase [Lachnospiraceae bacterium]|nr:alpha-1,2-fucosyltransferase [Lachnospiraceae bacterium]